MSQTWSGGCQCGAVRFRAHGAPKTASICHCRMCQKAVGNYFAAFAAFEVSNVEFTRGKMSIFKSSDFARRGFCAACGTPLSYQWDEAILSLSIGAFDDPDQFLPERQYASDTKIAHLDEAMLAPFVPMTDNPEEQAFLDAIRSHQHPDHDTESWPPSEQSQ